MEPFRFVHAARLSLDHSLCGTGPLPDTIRPIVEDATLLAWEKVVETCLSHAVDLLLLVGDDVELFEQGLRGPAALVRGLERLGARGIRVVIAGGAGDAGTIWPPGLKWPADVVRLEGVDEFAVRRDGKLLAIVRSEWDEGAPAGEAPWLLKLTSNDEAALRIVVGRSVGGWSTVDGRAASFAATEASKADYYATGGGATSGNIAVGRRLHHDSGPTQALRPLETGPRGCALVSVDAEGRWERVFVPTAPVRFESIHVTVGPDQTRDDLWLEMCGALERLPRFPSDRVWLVAANIAGTGPVLELLGDEGAREAFLASFHAEHGLRDVRVHVHAVRRHPTVAARMGEEDGDALLRQFASRVAERVAHPQWALHRCLDESRVVGGPWAAPLRSLLAELDAGEIAEDAHRLGVQWFAEEELSP